MVDSKKVIKILLKIAEKIEVEKDFLTDLDNKIGDGDHGINLMRGFHAVKEQLILTTEQDISTILKNTGMKLVSTVGGASGPLYGTAFLKAGMTTVGKTELHSADFIAMLEAAIGGIKMRGKAIEGEKTMLDSLIPALNALKEEYEKTSDFNVAIHAAVAAAEKGVEYTKTIIATKGRASYLGERSIGHQDPGATSSLMILQTIAANL